MVRINSVRSLAGLRDLLAIAEARPAGGTVAVPQLESAEEVQWIDQVLAEAGVPVRLVAQINTLRGVEQASAIAAASSRLAALMFGGLDLAAELGVPASSDALLLARSRTGFRQLSRHLDRNGGMNVEGHLSARGDRCTARTARRPQPPNVRTGPRTAIGGSAAGSAGASSMSAQARC
ncbi:aldolase/citrate lyase family protein [Azospirillum sp. BE72]|uniref:aldolase/citrate lyase family protein n=1 Tax=Azospirillum sp. BE72 TaxID=2817776 RepID=UPI0028648CF5|nr:aldolase/citrate lyase family protein [Azospirillum sp. BE72]MDR6775660.1 hypothetical protein [Azospirillum sp. BE72]